MTHFAHSRRTFRSGLRARAERGMTLIEIMVVITILGLIAAAVGVAVVPQLQHAKVETTKGNIRQVQNALKLYYTQKGKYPDTGDGLQALVTGKQLDNTPRDAWGKDLVYTLENGKPIVTSYGADGQPGGADDDADISSKDLDAAK